MNLSKAKNTLLILGITALLSGAVMKISHINYSVEILVSGLLLIGFAIVLQLSLDSRNSSKNTRRIANYPNIAQSFGITGIVTLGMLLFTPLNTELKKVIGTEASMLLYYLLSIGIPFWVVYSIRKKKTGETKFNLTIENARIIPFIIIGTMALLFGIVSPIGSLIPMPESIKKMFLEFAGQNGIFAFILMVIAAPVLEELIFRGIVLDGLLKKYTPLNSILISGLLFGLVHLNPWQFVTGFIIGIFSGWVYYKTRSLLPSIIIHATANLSGFVMRSFTDIETSLDETLLETYGGATNLTLAIAGSIIILSGCIYYLKKEFQFADEKTDQNILESIVSNPEK